MEWINNEIRLIRQQKMDAVALQGVWPTGFAAGGGGGAVGGDVAAGRRRVLAWLRILQDERDKPTSVVKETPRQHRRRLLDKLEQHLTQQAEDDLAIVLAV